MSIPFRLIMLCLFCGFVFKTASQSITSFVLINSATNAEIAILEDGDTIKLASTGNLLNIKANTSGTIGSVQFWLDGAAQKNEGVAPYAMFGDDSGDYDNWTPSLGNHVVKATPYAINGNTGSAGASLELTIVVVQGDGSTGSGNKVNHTYSENESFDVVLNITDDLGLKSSTVAKIVADDGFCGGTGYDLMAVDFNYASPAYKDLQGGKDILGVRPDEVNNVPVSGIATTGFDGESCYYDITLECVGENDGRSSFELFVANKSLGQFKPPLSTESFEFGERYNATFPGIKLNQGDQLKVKATTASIDGEWSRARWVKLVLSPVQCVDEDLFIEKDGVLVIEAESVLDLPSAWKRHTGYGSLNDGYIIYEGGNSMSSPGANSVMNYKIKINTPGTYEFKWWSRNGKTAAATDQENDSWLKIKADDFYGILGGAKVDCNDHFIKVWIHSMNAWSTNSKGEHAGKNGFSVFANFSKAGIYEIQVAGRSKNHPIDRMMLYKSNKLTTAVSRSTPASQIGCDLGGGGIIIDPDSINVVPGPFKTWNIPGEIEAVYFDLGGEGISYHDANEGWEGGLTSSMNPRYLKGGLEDVEVGMDEVSFIREDEWLNYTIQNTEDGIYDIAIDVSSIAYGGLKLMLNGEDLGEIDVRPTGGWTKYRTFTISDVEINGLPDSVVLKVQFFRTLGTFDLLLNLKSIRFVKQGTDLDNMKLSNIEAYPNPVSDRLIIRNLDHVNSIRLLKMDGIEVLQKGVSGSNIELDLNEFASGFYLLECLGNNNQRHVIKVIKQ